MIKIKIKLTWNEQKFYFKPITIFGPKLKIKKKKILNKIYVRGAKK